MSPRVRFIVRTPHAVVVDMSVSAARVRTDTGQVGIRPRMEPVVLAVEAGLVLLRSDQGPQFIGVAGGLLSCDGAQATMFTPLGVVGRDPAAVQQELEKTLAEPGVEAKVRTMLDTLEGRILTELRLSKAGRQASRMGHQRDGSRPTSR